MDDKEILSVFQMNRPKENCGHLIVIVVSFPSSCVLSVRMLSTALSACTKAFHLVALPQPLSPCLVL